MYLCMPHDPTWIVCDCIILGTLNRSKTATQDGTDRKSFDVYFAKQVVAEAKAFYKTKSWKATKKILLHYE